MRKKVRETYISPLLSHFILTYNRITGESPISARFSVAIQIVVLSWIDASSSTISLFVLNVLSWNFFKTKKPLNITQQVITNIPTPTAIEHEHERPFHNNARSGAFTTMHVLELPVGCRVLRRQDIVPIPDAICDVINDVIDVSHSVR